MKAESRKSGIFSFVLIFSSILAIILYIGFVDGFNNVFSVFLRCNKFWILFGFFLMICYWYLDYCVLNSSLEIFDSRLNFSDGIKNCMLGQFFKNITPSATGGQPFQAFFMNRFCKIKYGVAIGALVIKLVCLQVVLALFCVIVLIARFRYFIDRIQGFAVFVFVGFGVNFLLAAALILLGVNKKLTLSLIGFFIKILGKLKIFKEPDEKFNSIKKEIDVFNEAILKSFRDKNILLKTFFLTCLQVIVFYLVNVNVAFVFGMRFNVKSILNIIFSAVCVHISSLFVPLPGAVGGAEFLFCIIYDKIFSSGYISAALLLWRIYTFYLPIIVGLIFSKGLFKKNKKNLYGEKTI